MAERPVLTNRKAAGTANGRVARDLRAFVGSEIRRRRTDTGLSQRHLAALAAIDHGFLSLIERGLREPSLAVLAAIATALGGDVSVRLYPGTGPRLSDPIQARITEAVLRPRHLLWTWLLEVPVYRPVRGVIDLVAHDRAASGERRRRRRNSIADAEARAADPMVQRGGPPDSIARSHQHSPRRWPRPIQETPCPPIRRSRAPMLHGPAAAFSGPRSMATQHESSNVRPAASRSVGSARLGGEHSSVGGAPLGCSPLGRLR